MKNTLHDQKKEILRDLVHNYIFVFKKKCNYDLNET